MRVLFALALLLACSASNDLACEHGEKDGRCHVEVNLRQGAEHHAQDLVAGESSVGEFRSGNEARVAEEVRGKRPVKSTDGDEDILHHLGLVAGQYAFIHDQPEISLFLDRSEIAENLTHFHPLEHVDVLPVGEEGLERVLAVLLSHAAEVHLPLSRLLLLAFSLPPSSLTASRRYVVHTYAGGGEEGAEEAEATLRQGEATEGAAGAAGRELGEEEEDGSGSWVFMSSSGVKWEVLEAPNGFGHLDFGLDTPVTGDMRGQAERDMSVSLRAALSLPPRPFITGHMDGHVIFSGPLTSDPPPGVRNGADGSELCQLSLSWVPLAFWEGRCVAGVHLQVMSVGQHRLLVNLSSSSGRYSTSTAIFTVTEGALQQQRGSEPTATVRKTVPVQASKGHWQWRDLEVPVLGSEAREMEAKYKQHKRQLLASELNKKGLPPLPGPDEPHWAGPIRAQNTTISEQIHGAEVTTHTWETPEVVFPVPNSTLYILDKIPVIVVVRIAVGAPNLSPEVPGIDLKIDLERDRSEREVNITYLGEEQIQMRDLGAPHQSFDSGTFKHVYQNGLEAPHFMTIDHSASEDSVTVPSTLSILFTLTQGGRRFEQHATAHLRTRPPSTAMSEGGDLEGGGGGEEGGASPFEDAFVVTIRNELANFETVARIMDAAHLGRAVRWEAFDAKEQIAHEFALLRVPNRLLGSGSGWTLGAFGCAESHYRLLMHVLSRNLRRALVLEQDAALPMGVAPIMAGDILRSAMREVPYDAEILFVGHCFPRLRERENRWWVAGGACCTHGYVVSYDATLRLLPHLDPLSAPIDEIIRDLCFTAQLACYLLIPDPAEAELPLELPHGIFVQSWQSSAQTATPFP